MPLLCLPMYSRCQDQYSLTLKILKACGFSKTVFSRESLNPWIFVTFNFIIIHIFPKNVTEIFQVVKMIWRFSMLILTIFIICLDFLVINLKFKLMACFFTYNLLYIGCLTILKSYIDIGLALPEIWSDAVKLTLRKNYLQQRLTLLKLKLVYLLLVFEQVLVYLNLKFYCFLNS